MIRTQSEYQRALERLDRDVEFIRAQREQLEALGLSEEELSRAVQPALSFHEQLKEEVDTFERMKRGDLGTLHNLSNIGRWLIGVRIARGWSQKELADALRVSEAQVSRDERNEYYSVSTEKAQRIMDVLEVQFRLEEDSSAESPFERGTHRHTHPPTPSAQRGRDSQVESVEPTGTMPPPMDRSTPEQVALFLRADRKLGSEKATKLAQMFQLAYEAVASGSETRIEEKGG